MVMSLETLHFRINLSKLFRPITRKLKTNKNVGIVDMNTGLLMLERSWRFFIGGTMRGNRFYGSIG